MSERWFPATKRCIKRTRVVATVGEIYSVRVANVVGGVSATPLTVIDPPLPPGHDRSLLPTGRERSLPVDWLNGQALAFFP